MARRRRTSVDRVHAALDLVATTGSASVADLSAALLVDNSSGWRLAKALEQVGWLQREPASNKYRLGLALYELGMQALASFDVRAEARSEMLRLASTTGESADLAVRDRDTAVFVDTADGKNEVRAFTRPGQRAWLHAIAAGKVFLASMDPHEIDEYLRQPLHRYTSRTITTSSELRRVIQETQACGWGVNRGELHPEAGGLAVPIVDAAGACIAAIGLNVPLTRMNDEAVEFLVAELWAAKKSVEGNIGNTVELRN